MAATVGGDMVVRMCKALIPRSSHVCFGAEIGIAFFLCNISSMRRSV